MKNRDMRGYSLNIMLLDIGVMRRALRITVLHMLVLALLSLNRLR